MKHLCRFPPAQIYSQFSTSDSINWSSIIPHAVCALSESVTESSQLWFHNGDLWPQTFSTSNWRRTIRALPPVAAGGEASADISPQLGLQLSGVLVSLMSPSGRNVLCPPGGEQQQQQQQERRQREALCWAPSALCGCKQAGCDAGWYLKVSHFIYILGRLIHWYDWWDPRTWAAFTL